MVASYVGPMGPRASGIVTRSTTVLVLAMLLTSCLSGAGELVADDATGPALETERPGLEVVDGSSELFCDNTERLIAEIRGAEPGESIVVSSPRPIPLSAAQREATADGAGAYSLTWSCSPTEVGQPWELSIQGDDSGRQVIISFVGTATDPDGPPSLDVTMGQATFVCDGRSKTLGELTNAVAFEPVTFETEGADNLLDGIADADGRLILTWQCSPFEAGTWQVAARGVESGRVGRFTIVGVAPPPEDVPTPTVTIDEDPFVCDGGSRVFATLADFLPGEYVNFWAPDTPGLRDGRADESGRVPIRWTCGPAEAGTRWEVTATGTASGREVSFTVTGGEPPPGPTPTVTTVEEPFRCDGATRPYATIGGFVPREFVDFASPQADAIRQGQADEAGELTVRWTCGADDIGRIWEITATGASSLRSVSFQITGAASS